MWNSREVKESLFQIAVGALALIALWVSFWIVEGVIKLRVYSIWWELQETGAVNTHTESTAGDEWAAVPEYIIGDWPTYVLIAKTAVASIMLIQLLFNVHLLWRSAKKGRGPP